MRRKVFGDFLGIINRSIGSTALSLALEIAVVRASATAAYHLADAECVCKELRVFLLRRVSVHPGACKAAPATRDNNAQPDQTTSVSLFLSFEMMICEMCRQVDIVHFFTVKSLDKLYEECITKDRNVLPIMF